VTTLLTNRPGDRRVHFQVMKNSLPGEEFGVTEAGEIILRKVNIFKIKYELNLQYKNYN